MSKLYRLCKISLSQYISVTFYYTYLPMIKRYITWWIVWIFILARFGRGRWINRNVKRPQMNLIQSYGNIELRTMPSAIVANVDIPTDMDNAMNPWFQILAGYIFGGNTKRDSIAMTAPVTSTPTSEKIAMTAPVTTTNDAEATTVSFVMPEEYTLETLPIPDDWRISLVETSEKQVYVWSFDGYARWSRSQKQLELFKQELESNNLIYTWEFTLAQYNDPLTPPMMRLNEWWVEAQSN